MNFKWRNVEVTKDHKFSICPLELPLQGTVEVYEDINRDKIQVECSFAISSKGSAKGVPHLLEHAIFSNVIDGKSMFEAMPHLVDMGIDINAYTVKECITLVVSTGTVYNTDICKEDKDYQEVATRRSAKSYFDSIATIHTNLISTKIPKDYYEKEKEVVCSEIDTNYPADALDIDKILVPELIYGGDYSPIGTKHNVKASTLDQIECMRVRTFNPGKLKEIRIAVPMGTSFEYIEDYVNRLLDSMSENVEKAILALGANSPIMSDSCDNPKYKLNPTSYQLLSIDGDIKEKSIVFDLKLVENQRKMMSSVFTFPTVSLTDRMTYITQRCALGVFMDAFIEFYREVYPYMYRYDFLNRDTFEHNSGSYMSNSIAASFKEDLTIDEFNKTYKEFLEEFLPSKLNDYVATYKNRVKNSWYSFINGGKDFFRDAQSVLPLSVFKEFPLYFTGGVNRKIELIEDSIRRKNGSALPRLTDTFMNYDNDKLAEDVMNNIKDARVAIIRVSSKED